MQKNKLKQISTVELAGSLPELKNIEKSKATAIAEWLANFIEQGLNSGKIKSGSLLPSKPDMAFLLGVSVRGRKCLWGFNLKEVALVVGAKAA